ncbi:MAG: molybdenum cofactor biosynthesis protein MoaE [Cyclobacteriaceae bacterium]|nr:molybdenum cofactor biosynthesis protein MoaE [Cyclobacteriaceae bacterium]
MIKIEDKPLNVQEALDYVTVSKAGAVNSFIGTVRDHNKGKRVVRLEYEAYEKMAISEIEKIVSRAREQWPVEKVAVVHRTGILGPKDIAVIIAVSTPHRKASFEACEFIIDTLKETAPIWKKEIYEDGEEWISAHP